MGSCAAPSAKGDDKFITTDYLQQCPQCAVQSWNSLQNVREDSMTFNEICQ
ncbi:hypothetical protein APP27_004688 [Salmonella enterica subsp. enterica serovar Meleagridis]|uniref:Uncharacterized protein n=1 Tax=Salmonella enterica subsp. enterica serovar Stanley TaxID=192953 RepID=A0A736U7D6_SALET|nr:hypothetical protein [Escherichia coli]EDQ4235001.1 hypothetical protein [Salmonella enterica subsp. enterica serovar 4,[5],12:i:-]EDQ4802442.1 hypothetical protein [Salmonella enterica]EDQ8779736.1 hypothetical protein [Salmonella enterica subsp. enterica serovar Dublin]EDR6876022.1 hypothetical protein [Salmonella enterica subsp. enterica serovar Typhimurium]EDS1965034.1 hypothetical protein [Salmonella enterica subsp. enterica serovar Ohio]EDS6733490.1 hypothetical protein [Salmonella e